MLTNAVEKERKNVERGVGGRERKQVRSWVGSGWVGRQPAGRLNTHALAGNGW